MFIIFLISFLRVFSNISMSFDQFFFHQYFMSKYAPIFLNIPQYIRKTELSIYPSKLIFLSLFTHDVITL